MVALAGVAGHAGAQLAHGVCCVLLVCLVKPSASKA